MDLYPSLPEIPTQKATVDLANHLLKEFRIPTRIVEIGDITSSLFVVLYESLFSDRLPGIIREPASRDDEIHNCQVVIDVLSTDVIHDSLAHIRGEAIISGDLTSIFNLLDVFSHLLEYVMKIVERHHDDTRSMASLDAVLDTTQTEELVSSQAAGQVSAETAQTAALITSKKVSQDKKAEVQFHRRCSKGENLSTANTNQRTASLNKNENRKAYDEHRIITHEEFYTMTYGGLPTHHMIKPLSPIRHNQSQSLLGQKTIDSGFGVDQEKIDNLFDPLSHPSKMAWVDDISSSGYQNKEATDRDKLPPTQAAPPPQAPPLSAPASGFSASLPAPSQPAPGERQEPPRSTCAQPCDTTQEEAGFLRSPPRESQASHYTDQKQVKKRTAMMIRGSLEGSPSRNRAVIEEQSLSPSNERSPSSEGATSSERAAPSEGARLAQELNAGRMSPTLQPDLCPSGKKKVVFAGSQLETRDGLRGVSASRYCDKWVLEGIGEDVFLQPGVRQRSTIKDTGGTSVHAQSQKPKSRTLKARAALMNADLPLNKHSEIAAAFKTLRNEDLAIREKQEMLHKFYEKDREEFAEDVKYMLGRQLEKAAETEETYRQKCSEAFLRKKGAHKIKVTSEIPVWEKYERHQSPSADNQKSSLLTLEHEDDLLPFLMEEFPNLHLTEHTWHELRRKRLHQIEAITRAYQEVERKKTRAQNQLSEAAERHSKLSEIMRKQREHSQRMQEIKEQKQLQVQTRNKNHEKRIQSARARRYYNEYQVRARAKTLMKRTKEDMIFRKLFKDILSIQRERIKDIHKYVTDQRKRHEQLRQNEIDSLENYYHNQFEMLTERLSHEHFETEVRDMAQKQMLDRMKRELRQKMEMEIQQYQDQMLRTDDDVHFRQADADRLKQYLLMALYTQFKLRST